MIPEIIGFLLIHKPEGISSFGCIRYIKRILQQKVKIGHAGTLDPFASGLMIIAIGRAATREIDNAMRLSKEYVAIGNLGELTDTLDRTGEVIQIKSCDRISQDMLEYAINNFGASYEQIPPIYSALKSNGKPLYKLARQGKSLEVLEQIAEQKKRTVQLHELILEDTSFPFFTIRAHVSHGTYIRTLVNDVAKKVDCIATTYELKRTRIGQFSLEQSIALYDLKTIEDIENYLMPVSDFLSLV